mmetsp:Transcript_21847/g.32161  ORF Transcript_21847/g.32161 Transcript_21847/m.32161 type:complete len:298 (-) Transcript_21847:297-1190(-)
MTGRLKSYRNISGNSGGNDEEGGKKKEEQKDGDSDEEYIESREIRHVRKVWKESGGDPTATLKAMPSPGRGGGVGAGGAMMARERAVLKGLKRYGKDNALMAIRCLQHGVRMFWINAYQSYVWNLAVTERIRRLGTEVAIGDLYVQNRKDDVFCGDNDGEGGGGSRKKDVCIVSKENISDVDISQVVLPLPGYDVQYPSNEIGKFYEDILLRDNVSFCKDTVAEATAKGTYRDIVAFAKDLEWEKVKDGGENSKHGEEEMQQSDIVDTFKIRFELGSGSYATMMLRELMTTTLARYH